MRQALAATVIAAVVAYAMQLPARVPQTNQSQIRSVSGTAVHRFTTAIIHSETPTTTGKIQRSTDIVELSGDLKGRVLYHPLTVIDTVRGTLVNTGSEVFSGTVLGSEPVLLYDDRFRFEVNFKPGGGESGEVHLSRTLAGPKVACDLVVSGSGAKTPEGDGIVHYRGTCTFEKRS
ncbi:MAG TPA: hypothetical protein VM076_11845 [Gemmatimonadaceae bacterium]|nr:hypothetical protein [Gemmatimonadaceae bacterium]